MNRKIPEEGSTKINQTARVIPKPKFKGKGGSRGRMEPVKRVRGLNGVSKEFKPSKRLKQTIHKYLSQRSSVKRKNNQMGHQPTIKEKSALYQNTKERKPGFGGGFVDPKGCQKGPLIRTGYRTERTPNLSSERLEAVHQGRRTQRMFKNLGQNAQNYQSISNIHQVQRRRSRGRRHQVESSSIDLSTHQKTRSITNSRISPYTEKSQSSLLKKQLLSASFHGQGPKYVLVSQYKRPLESAVASKTMNQVLGRSCRRYENSSRVPQHSVSYIDTQRSQSFRIEAYRSQEHLKLQSPVDQFKASTQRRYHSPTCVTQRPTSQPQGYFPLSKSQVSIPPEAQVRSTRPPNPISPQPGSLIKKKEDRARSSHRSKSEKNLLEFHFETTPRKFQSFRKAVKEFKRLKIELKRQKMKQFKLRCYRYLFNSQKMARSLNSPQREPWDLFLTPNNRIEPSHETDPFRNPLTNTEFILKPTMIQTQQNLLKILPQTVDLLRKKRMAKQTILAQRSSEAASLAEKIKTAKKSLTETTEYYLELREKQTEAGRIIGGSEIENLVGKIQGIRNACEAQNVLVKQIDFQNKIKMEQECRRVFDSLLYARILSRLRGVFGDDFDAELDRAQRLEELIAQKKNFLPKN